jgi:transposase
MRQAVKITLTQEERAELEARVCSRVAERRCVDRAHIILMASQGRRNAEIANEIHMDPSHVSTWRNRFAKERLPGLEDRPRMGRPATKHKKMASIIIKKTTREKPKGATHWSTRTMAQAVGASHAMVQRVWSAANLKPHLTQTFKVSNDPKFIEKVVDVVGLYLDPPEKALVLCVDEKSQIQALDRTQPGLPMKKGRLGTMTHDYKRHGTTTLFAALEVATGQVIGECKSQHRHTEFLAFLRKIDKETPADLDLHLIVDNYCTHKHAKVQKWLERHPRFHFIPTSSSWLNLVERWFREITDKQIRRGVFRSVPALIETIEKYLHHHNSNAKPFVWTAKAKDIIAKYQRAKKALSSL